MEVRLQKLKEMESQKHDEAFLKFAIALEYVNMKNDKEASQYFELLLNEFPEYVAAYYHAGMLFERLNELQKAKEVYRKGIEIAEKANEIKTLGELKEALMQLTDEQE